MKLLGTTGALALLIAATAPLPSLAQQADAHGIGRTELVRHAFDGNRDAIQVRVDFGPHAAFPRHTHPGVEIAHVLAGTIEYALDGKTVVLKTGESLYIPEGVAHSARNVGAGNAAELATYLVARDKPAVVIDGPLR